MYYFHMCLFADSIMIFAVYMVLVIALASTVCCIASTSDQFFNAINSSSIIDIVPGCGKPWNRLIIFSDGTKACCKYRSTKLQQRSELYFYYLSATLDIHHVVPPVSLMTINFASSQWKSVIDKAKGAGWRNGRSVLLIMYMDNMQDVYLPSGMIDNGTYNDISSELSDMVILDYIAGHTDRLYCTLTNMQWSTSVLKKPIHNLGITSNHLTLYDNESCFTHGYRMTGKLQSFFIDRLCYFNMNTIHKLQQHVKKLRNLLQEVTEHVQIHNKYIPKLTRSSENEFTNRSKIVVERVIECNNQL